MVNYKYGTQSSKRNTNVVVSQYNNRKVHYIDAEKEKFSVKYKAMLIQIKV